MKTYYRIMPGQSCIHVSECIAGGFVGADFGINEDLTGNLPDEWREFNTKYIPIYLAGRPGKTKIAAGLACGSLWTIAKGMLLGDIVLCPDGTGHYRLGEVNGPYYYAAGQILPHRRPVSWLGTSIDRADMSIPLQKAAGAYGTVCNLSRAGYQEEIANLIAGIVPTKVISTDETIENPSEFALEKHLEDFLVKNWPQTDLGKDYDIYEADGEKVGQQYPTDTGPLDILAVSKDKKRLLVVELKKGRASDVVVGQILRYMGYVQEELLEEGQSVRGVIIALEDDQRIRRALTMTPAIEFYRYQITFKLLKVE